ncbi:MAG: glycosyltransferase family 4 protein [Acidobacteriota bacterium]|nr:glycosyltransferase family 4 protein [Acidobacteriota bacterium]
MKVAVLAHSFPRFEGDTHGPFVQHLSEALGRRGHEMHVLLPWDPELRLERDSPLRLHSFRYVWPRSYHLLGYSRTMQRDVRMRLWGYLQGPLYLHFATRALRRLVLSEGIELVHTHWILPNGYVADRVRRATGVPFAATLHGTDVFMAERNALFGSMAARALAGASHVTSCSADLQSRLVALGSSEHADKVHLVANGTDLVSTEHDAVATRRRYGFDDSDRLVVAVGRLVDKKGFRYLVDAAPEIVGAVPRARIVIGGEGELRADLEARAAQAGVGARVSFTGGLSHPQVLELLAAADVVVMPSVRDPQGNIDGLPIVVLEAMAAERAIVASDVAGMPLALEDDSSGVLVPERDSAAITAATVALLQDAERATTLGRAAKSRVEQSLTWDAIAGIHDGLYRAAPKEHTAAVMP